MIEFEVKVAKVSGSLRMTIPKEVCKSLQIQVGDKMLVTVTDHTMEVRKKSI